MDVKTQTVEQFLFEQLERVAPGKYNRANVLQQFRARLRFSCTHLKGGRVGGPVKDYNISIFTLPTGVIEIKCLYNCGLKIRSDEADLKTEFNELYDYPSTNSKAAAEIVSRYQGGKLLPLDPGPVPTYTDKQRSRIRESGEVFWEAIRAGQESGRIKPNDPVLGGMFPHPDPIEAPDTQIKRGIARAYLKSKIDPLMKAMVVAQDSIPALKPVTKIRKKRKTKSRPKVG